MPTDVIEPEKEPGATDSGETGPAVLDPQPAREQLAPELPVLSPIAGGAGVDSGRVVDAPSLIRPRLAFTLGTYRLVDFIHLGLRQLKKLSPDSPILVSDDASPESPYIKAIAEGLGAQYRCSAKRRGHFANDCQAFVHALAFAEGVGADVAVKVSQRFIFRKPEAIEAIVKAFEDPNILVATPGQPKVGAVGNGRLIGFGAFTTLSDVAAIRVGCISPAEMLTMYRERLMREKVPWGSFLECAIDEFHHMRFPGRTVKLDEITNHRNIEDPLYLRRYQNGDQQYRALAETHGMAGRWPLGEWGQIEGNQYLCRPILV